MHHRALRWVILETRGSSNDQPATVVLDHCKNHALEDSGTTMRCDTARSKLKACQQPYLSSTAQLHNQMLQPNSACAGYDVPLSLAVPSNGGHSTFSRCPHRRRLPVRQLASTPSSLTSAGWIPVHTLLLQHLLRHGA